MKNFWIRITAFLVTIVVLGGTIELAIHHYDPTRVIYRRLKAPDKYLYEEIDPALTRQKPGRMIDQDVIAAPNAVRAELVTMIWGPTGVPNTDTPINVKVRVDGQLGVLPQGTIVTRLDFNLGLGLTSNPYLLESPDGNNRLIVYHHGFGAPIKTASHFLAALIDSGFDVVAVNALGHGGTLAFVDSNQAGILPHARHKQKSNIFHEMSDFDRPLRYHLRPIYGAIDYARRKKSYRSVDVAGFSMGAFFATLLAALDPTIERSYPIAGVLPNYLRRGQEIMPDGPPSYPPLMDIANHLELFVLGASGEDRRQLQVFNRYDRCCFNGIRSNIYKAAIQNAVHQSSAKGRFDVLLDETHADHRISQFATNAIVKDLTHNR
ncbi:MAG: hypothetical protein CL573_04120 [Alphaproteobacteria bacterium]|nr:hypothetical protein [Alphaproteobacteria bacterium]